MIEIEIYIGNILAHKLRNGLTMTGIAIGIALIIILGTIGQGLIDTVQGSFEGMANIIDVFSTPTEEISDENIEKIKYIKGVEKVIFISQYPSSFYSGQEMFGMKVGTSFTAIEPEDISYTIGTKIYAESGRILEDDDNGKCVALIGNTFAKNTKLEIGDEIDYNNKTKFEIVGIIEKTGKDVDNMVLVPLKTMQEMERETNIQRIRVIADQNMIEEVSREIGFEVSNVNVLSYKELMRQITDALNSINLVVMGIGSISAIVAGLMVTVVMLMSVTERKREIGIMRAIGATKNMILKQFLLESAIIGLIGGTVGIILGSISALLLKTIFNFPSAINLWLIFIALGFALLITILAGFYPAWKASRLDPIESLVFAQ